MHKTDVLHRIDELPRRVDHAGRDGVRPELERLLELREDIDDLLDLHGAVGFARRRVTQLTDAGVAGAGVVPAV